jgi:hypothetical protein
VRTVVLVSAVLEQSGQTKTCTIVTASSRVERNQAISLLQLGQAGGSSCSSDLLSLSTMALSSMLDAHASLRPVSRPGQVHFGQVHFGQVHFGQTHAVPRPVHLLLLEPGQGLAWLASEQPIVLALAAIEHGHGHGDVPAGAAGLLLLYGLSLLAGLFAIRRLTHVRAPLGVALHQVDAAALVPRERILNGLFRTRRKSGREGGLA